MFTFELLELLHKYKTSTQYEQERIKSSIKELIKQHIQEYIAFKESQQTDFQTSSFLSVCEQEIEQEEQLRKQKQPQASNPFEDIKQQYAQWLEYYQNPQTQSECPKIALAIVQRYADTNYNIIKTVIDNLTEPSELAFKNALKNALRGYYATKIENYITSESYKNLGFFKKRNKRLMVLKVTEEIEKYMFNPQEIKEVLA